MSLREAVTEFLTDEAVMLDEGRFEDWLETITDDFRYWMPVDPAQEDPSQGVAHIHDDHAMISARMHRLAHPRAFSAEPPPDTVRLVGSVRVTDEGEGGVIVARSSLILLEHRDRDRFEVDTRSFGARVRHELVRHGETFCIRFKRVDALGQRGSFNALMVPF